jgi:hypothetical protein
MAGSGKGPVYWTLNWGLAQADLYRKWIMSALNRKWIRARSQPNVDDALAVVEAVVVELHLRAG